MFHDLRMKMNAGDGDVRVLNRPLWLAIGPRDLQFFCEFSRDQSSFVLAYACNILNLMSQYNAVLHWKWKKFERAVETCPHVWSRFSFFVCFVFRTCYLITFCCGCQTCLRLKRPSPFGPMCYLTAFVTIEETGGDGITEWEQAKN